MGLPGALPKNIWFTPGEDVQYNIDVIHLNLIKGNIFYKILTKMQSLLSLDIVGLEHLARGEKGSDIWMDKKGNQCLNNDC